MTVTAALSGPGGSGATSGADVGPSHLSVGASPHLPDVEGLTPKQAALAYGSHGWPVFPCEAANHDPAKSSWAKRPHSMLRDEEAARGEGGWKLATTDPDKIASWWDRDPEALIGVVPGMAGAVVLDADGAKGVKALFDVAKDFDLTSTAVSRTPGKGGGMHVWFDRRQHKGVVGNGSLRVIPGEARGDRGYVIVPPSRLPDGGTYQFQGGTAEVMPLPQWAKDVLPWETAATQGALRASIADVTKGDEMEWLLSHSVEESDEDAKAFLTEGIRRIAGAPKGDQVEGRHPTATRVAASLLSKAQRGEFQINLPEALGQVRAALLSVKPKGGGDFDRFVSDAIALRVAEDEQRKSSVVDISKLRRVDHQRDEAGASRRMGDPLPFVSLGDLIAKVDAEGPRKYLVRGLWPSGAYGVHAAEMKAQKTWNALDLAVSVASGEPWLNHFPIDDSGAVIVFAGEGGEASIVRRMRAICEAKQLDPAALAIHVSARAPHLSSDEHMDQFARKVEEVDPRLVILDPLYLSAGGAKGSDLYGMGELLERAQHVCDTGRTSLVVVTHFNRRKASGAGRISGAGPAEWGRVLINADVKSRHTDPATQESVVVTALDVMGGEVPDSVFRVKRTIRSDDPDDLNSPLRYSVEVLQDGGDAAADGMPPSRKKLLEAVTAAGSSGATSKELVDWIAKKYGHGLYRTTVSSELNELLRAGTVDCVETPGAATLWMPREGVGGVATTPPRHLATGEQERVSSSSSPLYDDDTPTPQNKPPEVSSFSQESTRCPQCNHHAGRAPNGAIRCTTHGEFPPNGPDSELNRVDPDKKGNRT